MDQNYQFIVEDELGASFILGHVRDVAQGRALWATIASQLGVGTILVKFYILEGDTVVYTDKC